MTELRQCVGTDDVKCGFTFLKSGRKKRCAECAVEQNRIRTRVANAAMLQWRRETGLRMDR